MSKLEEFIEVVQKDPLFAAEGMNTAHARAVLDEIEGSLKKIRKGWKSFSANAFLRRYPLREVLYPVDFCRAFVEAEECRRAFLLHPDETHARLLLKTWLSAAQCYERNARSFHSALRASLKLDAISSHTSVSYFQSALQLQDILIWSEVLLKNAGKLYSEAKERVRWPQERITIKEPKAERIAALKDNIALQASSIPQDAIRLLEFMWKDLNITDKHQQVAYATSAFNPSGTEPCAHSFFVAAGKSDRISLAYLDINLADELYFFDMNTALQDEQSHVPLIFRPMVEAGYRYWYQQVTNWYRIPDLSLYADIATLWDFSRRPLDHAAVLRQRSSALDLLLGTALVMSMTTETNALVSAYYEKEMQLSYLLFVRSFSTFFFLPFNESVWRIAEDGHLRGTSVGTGPSCATSQMVLETDGLERTKDIIRLSLRRREYFAKELAV